jgi:hypothetical protein
MRSPYGNIIAMARTSLGLKNRKNNLRDWGKNTGASLGPIGGKVTNRRGLRSRPLQKMSSAINPHSSSTPVQLLTTFHHEAPISIPLLLLPHPPLLHSPPPHLLTQTSHRPTHHSIRPAPQSARPQRRTCRFESS